MSWQGRKECNIFRYLRHQTHMIFKVILEWTNHGGFITIKKQLG